MSDFFEILPAFKEFIKLNTAYYKFNIAEANHCNTLIKELVVNWGKRIKVVASEEDAKNKIETVLSELSAAMDGSIQILNYDVSSHIDKNFNDYFNELIGIVVPELNSFPDLKERFWGYICNYFNLSLANETNNAMGLFFAGYGSNDAFPKFVHIELYRVVGGKLKYKLLDRCEESNNQAQIVPLAQKDVILTFCKGISNTFINYIPSKVESVINAKLNALPDMFTEEQKHELKTIFGTTKNEIASAIDTAIQKDNVKPILDSVQLIPLPEMAFLAESLVNITSLKHTFAIDGNQQTVGGPTDVAVMSKGDGFVWIKRKHYFDDKINPNYILKLHDSL